MGSGIRGTCQQKAAISAGPASGEGRSIDSNQVFVNVSANSSSCPMLLRPFRPDPPSGSSERGPKNEVDSWRCRPLGRAGRRRSPGQIGCHETASCDRTDRWPAVCPRLSRGKPGSWWSRLVRISSAPILTTLGVLNEIPASEGDPRLRSGASKRAVRQVPSPKSSLRRRAAGSPVMGFP